jgi:hypothetical protein
VTESLVSASDAFAGILAARASVDKEVRRKAVTRTVASVAVALLHVALFALFIVAERMPPIRKAAVPQEVTLILTQVQKPAALQRIINANPEKKRERVEEFEPRPITLPPIVAPVRPPVDVMRALGVELACGASHYEYLNPVERKLCPHAPWTLPTERSFALVPTPQPEPGHMTGAEAAARARAQAPPCAPGTNVPCVDEIIYGKGPH